MEITKAIDVLTRWKEEGDWESEKELAEAEQLGIEALKRVEDMRISPCTTADEILPSETE